VAVQTDGRILVGGYFQYQGISYDFARLNTNGTLDPTFALKGTGPVRAIAPAANGAVLIGGSFSAVGSTIKEGIARLSGDPVISSLATPDASTIEWRRAGSPVEFDRVIFESKPEGGAWSSLGEGRRTADGWQVADVSPPANGIIRARGFLPPAGDTSIHDEYLSVGTTRPALTVMKGTQALAPGDVCEFGKVLTGIRYEFDFQLVNSGGRKLSQISVGQISGATVTVQQPASLQPGETGNLRIAVNRSVEGLFEGSFTISSDAAENPSHPVRFTVAGSNVISPVFSSASQIGANGVSGLWQSKLFGSLTLEFAPQPGTVLTVIRNYTFPGAPLKDLPDGMIVSADFNGVTYRFIAGYQGNGGGDLTLTLLGDGVIEKSYITSGTTYGPPLAMQGDGSLYVEAIRWDARGVIDPVFRNAADPGNAAMLADADGGLYLASVPSAVPKLVRIRNDGSLDPGFNAPLDGVVTVIAAQPDGKIIVGGTFTSFGGQTRKALARLNRDGSLDPGFDTGAPFNFGVNSIVVLPGGDLIVGAAGFPSVTPGGTQTKVARFHPDGSRDLSFETSATLASQLLVQADGKIVVIDSEQFTTPAKSLRRFLPDGSPDNGFSVASNGVVTSAALQADGKLLICGYFTKIGPYAANRLARLHPDGSLDPTFFGAKSAIGGRILIGSENRILLAAGVGTANGVTAGMAEIGNPTASARIEVSGMNTVRWMRDGGAAELQWVNAEFIPQDAAAVSLGLAQRIPGGWEITSPVPLSNGTVHLSGPPANAAGMCVLVEDFKEVGSVFPVPVVTVNQQPLPPAETYDLGNSLLGIERSLLMTVENRGAGNLQEAAITIEGGNAADFSIVQSSPVDLEPGGRRSFLVKFKPAAVGLRTADLIIHGSNATALVIPLRYHSRDTIDPVFDSTATVALTQGNFNATGLKFGGLTLGFAPPPRSILKVVSDPGFAPITGTLQDLPNQSYVSATFGGVVYRFVVNYAGGDGNDLTLRMVGLGDVVPGFLAGANSSVYGLAIQPDGNVLIGGRFTKIGAATRTRLARLHPDGSLDISFNASANDLTESFVVLDDDRILAGGVFTQINGALRKGIACLNPDGSLSESFNLQGLNATGARVEILRLLKLKSGKILIGGQFTSISGVARKNIARLNADGSLDLGFNASVAGQSPHPGYVYSLFEQDDGKLLVGGRFGFVNEVPRQAFARLNADGSLDGSFNNSGVAPDLGGSVTEAASTRVNSVIQLPGGGILLGGEFTSVSGQPRTRLARLNADGSVDGGFTPTVNGTVSSLALQEDGKTIVTGLFSQASGQSRLRVARLFADGSLDPDFQPESNSSVQASALDRQGKLWISGEFTTLSGLTTQGVTKLENSGSGMTLGIVGTTSAVWTTSDTSPALRGVTFEISADGRIWNPLGPASKISGAWSLDGLALPADGFLRARGFGIGSSRAFTLIEETLLFGRQPTHIEQWRMDHFGSFTNQRSAANLADPDQDGLKNLIEYAFAADPWTASAGALPQWSADRGGHQISFLRPPGVVGVSYTAEWSATLSDGDWHEIPNSSNSGGGYQFAVPVNESFPRKFMRLRVSSPED
jgi:uncharacterized delta-60 repeat protein